MSVDTTRLTAEALSLPPEEREELVRVLLESLEQVGLPPAWRNEIARRLERIRRGEAVLVDAETQAAELATKLGG